MKHHIRYIALLLALVSLLSLTACASILQAISPTPSPSPTPTATPTPTPSPTPTPTPTPMPTPTPVPALSVDDLQLGYGGPYGYFNKYFGFGMKLPKGWYIFSREEMDNYNGFDTAGKDAAGILQMYIDTLKQGYIAYDINAMPISGDDNLMILLADYSSQPLSQHTEFAVLQTMQDWAMDYNGDRKSDAKNLQLTFVNMLGEEHAVYRYDMKSDGVAMHGGYLVLKQGTTFAIIIIDAVDTATIDEILNSFYTV